MEDDFDALFLRMELQKNKSIDNKFNTLLIEQMDYNKLFQEKLTPKTFEISSREK